jgi:hypothetical protein
LLTFQSLPWNGEVRLGADRQIDPGKRRHSLAPTFHSNVSSVLWLPSIPQP